MAKSEDYYKLLGVSIFASQQEIRSAYLKRIKEYHPDTYKGNHEEAENITASLNIAYSTLKDKDKKYVYDKKFGFDTMRDEILAQRAKEEKKRQKKERKKNNSANTKSYAPEKDKKKNAEKTAEFYEDVTPKKKKIKTNIFTKKPKKEVKSVHRVVLTPEQQKLRRERIFLDSVIIALLIAVILLIIFS